MEKYEKIRIIGRGAYGLEPFTLCGISIASLNVPAYTIVTELRNFILTICLDPCYIITLN